MIVSERETGRRSMDRNRIRKGDGQKKNKEMRKIERVKELETECTSKQTRAHTYTHTHTNTHRHTYVIYFFAISLFDHVYDI